MYNLTKTMFCGFKAPPPFFFMIAEIEKLSENGNDPKKNQYEHLCQGLNSKLLRACRPNMIIDPIL
ncbi:uncharacterized protein BX663DRAFT_514171 [Cokeromyces recurvatus]|uniref:uncharacterized protein n=1 Tax=Cokeromyces recurvatus TaxID=90255 RepID=UPI00222073D1|nr:uncharacterized protein BX663DRAFT_514171 [Cokeromyces recurvatus]KAI7901345.1 hypothetical protein BX663DRAFT_514171 [Cokeromyces recurvatus]